MLLNLYCLICIFAKHRKTFTAFLSIFMKYNRIHIFLIHQTNLKVFMVEYIHLYLHTVWDEVISIMILLSILVKL